MASWDDEEFDPEAGFQAPADTDRWDGEDEEEPLKASWEDDDDEKKEGDENKVKAVQVKKKKKKIEDILKEKEEKKRREMEERRKQKEQESEDNTEERRKQLQEESDLLLAKEAFGVTDDGRATIDSMNPKSNEEFKEFGKMLEEKILKYAESEHYVDLLEGLFQACSLDLDSDQLKKIGASLTQIGVEKAKAKAAATKAGKKKTKKAVLAGSGKSSRNVDLDAFDMGGDEMDDFM